MCTGDEPMTGGVRAGGLDAEIRPEKEWAASRMTAACYDASSAALYEAECPAAWWTARNRRARVCANFYFNKNGGNGSYVAAVACLQVPRAFTVETSQGAN